jgi:hypothetical protein
MHTSTWPWLVRNVQLGLAASSGSLFGRATRSMVARFVKQQSGSRPGLAERATCRRTKIRSKTHDMWLVGALALFGGDTSTFDEEGQ